MAKRTVPKWAVCIYTPSLSHLGKFLCFQPSMNLQENISSGKWFAAYYFD